MCLEAAEILCGVHWNALCGLNPSDYSIRNPPPYKRNLAQRKHPIVLWAGENSENYAWLYEHYLALGEEYHIRYKGNPKLKAITSCKRYLKNNIAPRGSLYFRLATQDPFFHDFDKSVVWKYRLLMLHKFSYLYKRQPKWSNRSQPSWLYNPRYESLLQEKFGPPVRKLK
jgi:hypothetical protein